MRGPEIILASSSPRRQSLLSMIGWQAHIQKPDIEEKRRADETIEAYIARNAQEKALSIFNSHSSQASLPILAADTVVILKGSLLEKPQDTNDAVRMLRQLSGCSHTVKTAFHWCFPQEKKGYTEYAATVITEVTMRHLHEAEIQAYVASGSPMDKAGSYGIQDDVGAGFVKNLQGSYTNVVGLPLSEVIESYYAIYPHKS